DGAPRFLDAIADEFQAGANQFNGVAGANTLAYQRHETGGAVLRGSQGEDFIGVYPAFGIGNDVAHVSREDPSPCLKVIARVAGRDELRYHAFAEEGGALRLQIDGDLFDAPGAARRLAQPWMRSAQV